MEYLSCGVTDVTLIVLELLNREIALNKTVIANLPSSLNDLIHGILYLFKYLLDCIVVQKSVAIIC